MNRVERYYRLGEYEGRIYACDKIIDKLQDEIRLMPNDNPGKLYLRAVLGDVYALKSESVRNQADWRRSVETQDAIEDNIRKCKNSTDEQES